MKINRVSLIVSLAISILAINAPAADKKTAERQKLQRDVDTALAAFKKTDSNLEETFKKAAGYVIFPNVGKGGFIVGGAHGNGIVYEAGKVVGYASLAQATVGAQIGGQEFSEVIFFETKDALAKFKEGGFAMSAQVSAVAAAEGASQNARYVDGVMVFTRAKQGLMAEASVGGQKFKFEPAPQ